MTKLFKEDYLSIREQQEEPKTYIDGFGWKAVISGFFVGFLMVPGNMFLSLMTGHGIGAAADWVTLIVFIEIAKRCHVRLNRQEMYIIFSIAGGVLGMASGSLFQSFIWNQYLVQSPAAEQFGIAERIPIWVAPPPKSEAYAIRSLLHRDWWPHITLMAIGLVWGRLNLFSLGYALFRITSDIERLPFPLAPIHAQGVTALAESDRETWRWRCFSIGATVGIVFGAVYVGVPAVTTAVFDKALYIIKVPFYDYTRNFENVLPAVPLKINTNLGQIFVGFVLPFWMIIGSAVAGVLGQLLLNPILYKYGVLHTWHRGMTVIETGVANRMDFWLSWGIGTALAVGLIGFFKAGQALWRSRKSMAERRKLLRTPKGRGDIPVPLALLFYLSTTTWTIMLCHLLVPKFPVWILFVFGYVYTPLMSYISARMVGLTGHGVGFPYVDEAAFILSGYKGVDIWWAPVPLHNSGGGAQSFREVELTGTRFVSLFKAQLFKLPLAILCSLFFWSFIWRMGEIPSQAYPYAAQFWPPRAFMACFWRTATTTGNAFFLQAIKFKVIAGGLGFGLIAYPIMVALGLPTLLLYGIIRGFASDPMDAIPEVFAAFLGRYYMARKFGLDKWRRYTPVLAAGYGCGMGLIGMVSVAVALIGKAISQLPF